MRDEVPKFPGRTHINMYDFIRSSQTEKKMYCSIPSPLFQLKLCSWNCCVSRSAVRLKSRLLLRWLHSAVTTNIHSSGVIFISAAERGSEIYVARARARVCRARHWMDRDAERCEFKLLPDQFWFNRAGSAERGNRRRGVPVKKNGRDGRPAAA